MIARLDASTIGLIETGWLGASMAGHRIAVGDPLVVHDAHPGARRPLVERGARWVAAPADVARRAAVLITRRPAAARCRDYARPKITRRSRRSWDGQGGKEHLS
jgi:3-hydroxyisobutyrate dehydrogenase-like beta-hydroxyacid dehydrogenase